MPESEVANERGKYALALLAAGGVGAFVLQTTLLHHLPVSPDLLLILCVYLGIYHRSVGGATSAFCLGYGLDSCSGAPAGMNAFAMSLVFTVVAATSRSLWLHNPLSVFFLVLLAVVLKTSTFLCLGEVRSLAVIWQPMIAQYVMWDAVVALLLTPLVFSLLYRGEVLTARP